MGGDVCIYTHSRFHYLVNQQVMSCMEIVGEHIIFTSGTSPFLTDRIRQQTHVSVYMSSIFAPVYSYVPQE